MLRLSKIHSPMTNSNNIIKILFFFGRPLSPLYSLLMSCRAWLYARGLKRQERLPLPVISVGNLSMGGTGKTPMVIYLGRLFKEAGLRPAVLSRGYGGSSKEAINVVSREGAKILLTAQEAGDEPVLLAKELKIPVITGRQRIITGRYIVEQGLANVLILDDGFQHLALARNLNLALFNAASLPKRFWVFPGGPWREPGSALKRADCFVINGAENINEKQVKSFCLKLTETYPGRPIFRGHYTADSLIDPQGIQRPISALPPGPLLAFCGIARPESFFQTLNAIAESRVIETASFQDHHAFQEKDMISLNRQAEETGCTALITTEKDMVKLNALSLTLPLWILRVKLTMPQDFKRFVLAAL